MIYNRYIFFIDIDECQDEPCGHNATCENTRGSYACKCGHAFNNTGNTCDGLFLILKELYYLVGRLIKPISTRSSIYWIVFVMILLNILYDSLYIS